MKPKGQLTVSSMIILAIIIVVLVIGYFVAHDHQNKVVVAPPALPSN